MNRVSLVIIVAFSVLLFSCSSGKKESSEDHDNTEAINSEYILEEFPIYEPNSILFPVFDTVLQSVRECPEIKESTCVYCLSISRIDEFNTTISIELREKKSIYCSRIDGVFLYKGAVFKLNINEQDSVFFKRSNKVVKAKCQKDNIFTNDFNDAMIGVWEYIIENNQVNCVSFGVCGNYWHRSKN
ncbi:MAG: hypothetical protein C0592_07505 [Marinilabiliales bacterium]|nr:MAG: hypothetical protein C0592_07505 [Marinilabiliales bacterium]